jgi:hypothetical protein
VELSGGEIVIQSLKDEGEYKRFNEEDKKQKEQEIREFLKEFCQ